MAAQLKIGITYLLGKGVIKNEAAALKWLLLAADQGNSPYAKYVVGYTYYFGVCGWQDYSEAAKWILPAAERGIIKAQLMLGSMYEDGVGVEQDIMAALRWYQSAADAGEPEAQLWLGLKYWDGSIMHGVDKNYAQVLALTLVKKAAKQSLIEAQSALGEMYAQYGSVFKNYPKAIKWLTKAAEQNYGKAQAYIGIMHEYGLGVDKDYNLALEWYYKAIEQDLPFDIATDSKVLLWLLLNKKLILAVNEIFPNQENYQKLIINLIENNASFEYIVTVIINNKGNINAIIIAEDQITLLMFACAINDYNVVKQLVINGAKKNIQNVQGHTVLYYDFSRGDAKLISYLLEQDCCTNLSDCNGNYPEIRAIKQDKVESLQMLCEFKQQADSSLIFDVGVIRKEIFKQLIIVAEKYKATNCLQYLEQEIIEKSVNAIDNENKFTGLYFPSIYTANNDKNRLSDSDAESELLRDFSVSIYVDSPSSSMKCIIS